MKKYLDWNPKGDKFLKKKEIEIHHKLHAKTAPAGTSLDAKHQWRAKMIKEAQKVTGVPYSGDILDIGCGNGWSSAYVARIMKSGCVYAMEIDEVAVTKLIPDTFKAYGVGEDKYKAVLGSFNNIPHENKFDFVISMGTLHHSENLVKTFDELYKAMKPGAWLVASEPCQPNNITNAEYMKRYTSQKNFWGVAKLREDERTDRFYRLCEWETAAYHSGFNVYPFVFDNGPFGGSGEVDCEKWDYNKSLYGKTCYTSFSKVILDVGHPGDQMLLVLQKPEKELEYIPHRWEND